MDRTPVRVRGRKGNKAQMMIKSLEASRGSRLATPASSTSVEQSPAASDKSRKKSKSYHMSNLEQLPNELLHRIFEYALNLDLPAVSLHLARAFNGKGAESLKMEYSLRALYKPLSHLHDKWQKQEELVQRSTRLITLTTTDIDGMSTSAEQLVAADDSNVPGSELSQRLPEYNDVKAYLLKKLKIVRWKDYRQPQLQERLINSRFFTWSFVQQLILRAHPIFSKELLDVHAALNLAKDDMLTKESWWGTISADELVNGMQTFPRSSDRFPAYKQNHRLPWLRFAEGVSIPKRCTHGPWAKGEDTLLFWLNQGNCGYAPIRKGGQVVRSDSIRLPLPTGMLADAVRLNKEWIVHLCAMRAKVSPTTEMLQDALTISPFPFIVIQNLLRACRPKGTLEHREPPLTIDPLDPQVWSFIEEQERAEAERAKALTRESMLVERVSVAKWLRYQMRQLDQPFSGADALPYIPLRPAMENLLFEWAPEILHSNSDGCIDRDAKIWEILIDQEPEDTGGNSNARHLRTRVIVDAVPHLDSRCS